MTLLSRVSLTSARTSLSKKTQLYRLKFTEAVKSSSRKSLSTESGKSGSSKATQSLVNGIGNAILGTVLVGAGAGTIFFTYLRFKDSGFRMGVEANTIMEEGLHPAAYPWPNNHPFATFDHNRYVIFT
jgi:ubiquinol-cytochrome c reductase cytochrome c1 subunit